MPKNKESVRSGKFEPSPEGNDHIKSAKAAIKEVLKSDIRPRLKKILLYHLIWQITTAHSKYHTRYRSAGVLKDHADSEMLHHEHVYTIKWLIAELSKPGSRIDEVLNLITACVVTQQDHGKLKASGVGWERYRDAKIEVYDMGPTLQQYSGNHSNPGSRSNPGSTRNSLALWPQRRAAPLPPPAGQSPRPAGGPRLRCQNRHRPARL